MSFIRLEVLPGDDVEQVALEAVRIANILRIPVSFAFLGVECAALPGASADLIASRCLRAYARGFTGMSQQPPIVG